MTAIFNLLMLICFALPQSELNWIDWSAEKKLTYTDFQGRVPVQSKNTAISSIKLDPDYTILYDSLHYTVHVYFQRGSSWMKYDDPEILAHEQSHFDMGEAYARKCRQFLTSLAGKKTSYNELDSTIKLLYSQLIQSESLYDKETSNGINRVEQARWDLRIQKMLDSLADYKSPDGDVMLK